jgi:hypothetical protein
MFLHFTHANFADLVEILFHRLEKEQLQLFAVTTLLLWMRQNKWVFDNEFQPPAVITKLAHKQHRAYEDAELSRAIHLPAMNISEIQQWTKPPVGVVKLNWDAALNTEKKIDWGGHYWTRP